MERAVFVQPARRGEFRRAISTETFIQNFKKDIPRQGLARTGLQERITNLQVSIQLVRSRGRWWIASVTTEFEGPGKPLPRPHQALRS